MFKDKKNFLFNFAKLQITKCEKSVERLKTRNHDDSNIIGQSTKFNNFDLNLFEQIANVLQAKLYFG